MVPPRCFPPHGGRDPPSPAYPHEGVPYCASYAKALYKSCSTFCVPCGTHVINLHDAQPRFGAELVFVLQFYKITVFIYNCRRSIEIVDFLKSIGLKLVTS